MLGFIKRQDKRAFRPTTMPACDNYALDLLKAFDFDYQPWAAAAIRPSALCAILNEIIINRRCSLVEFESGISTLYIGRLLQQTQGKLISFEHDSDWHAVTTGMINRFNLADTVDVVVAPLANSDHALANCQWYDEQTVRDRLSSVVLDGVIVDGPPASSPSLSLSRYPAVPVVQEVLGDTFFIYLDDIDRPGETQVFGRWETTLGINGATESLAGQYGMLRKGGRFATKICNID